MERVDSLHVADIAGAQAKPARVRTTDFPFNSAADISGAAPRVPGLQTNRHTSALNPQYELPSFTHEPRAAAASQPRDTLWTLPQPRWKAQTRDIMDWTDIETRSRTAVRRQNLAERDPLAVKDITGPQFRVEQQTSRRTNPLEPTYVYDGGDTDRVNVHAPKHGHRYVRKEDECFSLMSKDVTGEGDAVWTQEYPKHLIKTRETNQTSDIRGAAAALALPPPRPAFAAPHTPRARTTARAPNARISHARAARRRRASGHAVGGAAAVGEGASHEEEPGRL
jgi:hypothetical protein